MADDDNPARDAENPGAEISRSPALRHLYQREHPRAIFAASSAKPALPTCSGRHEVD